MVPKQSLGTSETEPLYLPVRPTVIHCSRQSLDSNVRYKHFHGESRDRRHSSPDLRRDTYHADNRICLHVPMPTVTQDSGAQNPWSHTICAVRYTEHCVYEWMEELPAQRNRKAAAA